MKCFLCGFEFKTLGLREYQGVAVCKNKRLCLIRTVANWEFQDVMPVYDRALEDAKEREGWADEMGRH